MPPVRPVPSALVSLDWRNGASWLLHGPSATSNNKRHDGGTIPQFCRPWICSWDICYLVRLHDSLIREAARETSCVFSGGKEKATSGSAGDTPQAG